MTIEAFRFALARWGDRVDGLPEDERGILRQSMGLPLTLAYNAMLEIVVRHLGVLPEDMRVIGLRHTGDAVLVFATK